MQGNENDALRAAMAALEGQRSTLGDAVVEMALAPLRERLAGLARPAGLQLRQVTVLFADIVGSTAMAQELDAEDAMEVLGSAMRNLADIVEAHQGRVLRFTGDGIKAAFGMAEAREDDAERAVRAGLAMLQAGRELAAAALRQHGVQAFAVRVGVHTGSVALGAGVEADNTAMGAAVHIAARMEQSAPPGGLRISHDTWNQVRGLFETEAQPPLAIKGVDAPMQTHLVRAALARGFAGVERGLQGLSSPLVGRDAELARLREVVEHARHTRQLQGLSLVGEAGLGKSRLLRDLSADLSACHLLVARSQSDGLLRPWGLLRGLLAGQFGIADTDSAESARRKLVDGLTPWFDADGERQAQLIGQLSGLDFGDSPHVQGLDPRSLRDQAFAAFRSGLKGLAAHTGALPVIIVEDLHWADDGSLELLQHLLKHADDLPVALIMTCRPALLARKPDWGTAQTLLHLAPLAAEHSGQLAQVLLQRLDTVPARLAEMIIGQAEGNPYYMEELVRRLVDDGVIQVDGPRWTLSEGRLDAVRVPGTLVGLLQSRLDALPGAERAAARRASVIGHVFWDDALQALDADAPMAMHALQRSAFVRLHETSVFEGTVERQFDHHLLHQVTYDTLVRAERRLGHGAVARWLVERTQGRGAEFLAMTGDHAERAGDTVLAVDCFDRAAAEAQKRCANTAAEAYLRRALALLGESESRRRFGLLDRLQILADTVGDRASQEAALEAMAALLDQHPDDALRAELLFSKALLAERRGEVDVSERLSRQSLELAERCALAQSAAMARGQLAYLHIARREAVDARQHIDIGLQWAARIERESQRAATEAKLLVLSGMLSTTLGRYDEAREALLAMLARATSLGEVRLQLGALDNLAVVAERRGQWDEALDWGERMRTLATARGALPRLAHAQLHLASAAQALGDAESAMRWHEQILAITRANGDRRVEAASLQQLGTLQLARGDARAALQSHTQAAALHEGLNDVLCACEALAAVALCEAGLGEAGPARVSLDRVLARMHVELSNGPAYETIGLRWTCQRVLDALADPRAGPLLEQLFADVQTRAAEIAPAADHQRLIQSLPDFRAIDAAYRQARSL